MLSKEDTMNTLFEPVKIGTMEIKNRFVRSATYDGSAKRSGHVSERQLQMFDTLAHGGVGLIVTGITYVDPSGQNLPFQNSMASDEYIPGFKKLTDIVHNRGAKIAIQLFHAGRERVRFLKDKTEEAIAPSFVKDDPYFSGNYRSLEEDEIRQIIENFGDAARRSREAGFDAVQVHGAHGFLLSQFLSPYTNHREDDCDLRGGDQTDALQATPNRVDPQLSSSREGDERQGDAVHETEIDHDLPGDDPQGGGAHQNPDHQVSGDLRE